jgi:hypothetical protein
MEGIGMTVSGTTTFNLDLTEIVEESYSRCGYELRTGWDLRTARISLNLMLASWANRGINLWSFTSGTIPLVAGVATYDLPSDTVDLLEQVIRTGAGNPVTQSDLTISRISVSTYATIPNKTAQGRPIQVWIERLTDGPRITLWPVPNQGTLEDPYYIFAYWRMRRLDDAGDGSNTMDVPYRFYEALVAGLAYHLAMKVPGGMERLQVLKAQYDEAWELAAGEDHEKAPIRFVPRIGYIR